MGNRLLGMKQQKEVPEVGEQAKPTGGWAYNIQTGEGKLFQTKEERDDAFMSGEWVKSPALVPGHKNYKGDLADVEPEICEWFKDGVCTKHSKKEEAPVIVPEDEGPIPEIGRPEPRKVTYKKVPSNMNKAELIAEGARVGIELDPELTNPKMRDLIRKKTGYTK